ncbi:MAG: hypothetical protein AMJ81_05120 [Phycisphaerae bacterium SM23_33]|nr:MAG: hypothetical protein AMJ81_05120 [Phycisphaerae bacterium SM23_33]
MDEHPRLVFRPIGTPGARTFQTVRDLYNSNGGNNPFKQEVDTWLYNASYSTYIDQASRYVITGNLSYAESALNSMYGSSLSYGGTEGAFTGAQWALAYDWIHDAWEGGSPPANLSTKLAYIESEIADFVGAALSDLDGGGPSLWHGRASLGAVAWVAALALPAGNATYDTYRTEAWDDWQQSLKATHACGGWPEGPTYWATNRGVNFPLAYQSYTSAVTGSPALAVADPMEDLRQLGLWMLYTERGDGSFNRYGDVSSQVVINNGTIGQSIDYYAIATGDPALAAFAEHARDYRYPLYWSGYRWMLPVTYDPTIPKPPGYDPAHPAECLGAALPNAAVFGRDALGLVVMRQGWSDGDTQISFKAGDYLAHHGHYDQGTFTLFKHDKLVINSGGYGPYTGDHRLNYYVRTVAKNGILVQRPDEMWTPPSVTPPSGWANDGGQRIVQATGSTVSSYENWLANKTSGWNYESGEITAFDNVDGAYSYVASDITRAYNSTLYDCEGQGGKVSLVTRQLVYLQDADVLVVFDRVNATNAAYKKKWLLHTPNKFVGGTEVVAVGSASNGIIEVDGDTIPGDTLTMTNGGGKLFLQVLLPASYTVNKVGGLNYRYYVEDDGDDADGYDGTNYDDYSEVSYHDYGDWRIEVSPKAASNFDTFLNVLSPRSSATSSVDPATVLLASPLATVMRVGGYVVGMGTAGLIDDDFGYTVPEGGTFRHLIVDLQPEGYYKLTGEAGYDVAAANEAGLALFTETAAAAHGVVITSVLCADANFDDVVDGLDYNAWSLHYLASGMNWGDGDFNFDTVVDGLDYNIWSLNYAPEGAAVPEPAFAALLGLGLAVVAWRRRRA